METKTINCRLELKELKENGVFSGYGAIFNNVDAYQDVILPGAFSNSLAKWAAKKQLPKMLWQHRADQPIGVYSEIREDEKGLFVAGQITTDASLGADAYALIKSGAIDGLSIGFNTVTSELDNDSGLRKLTEIDLWEVSLVTFPANDQAYIETVKSLLKGDGSLPTERELERFLREVGCLSKNQARAVVAKGYDGLGAHNRREAGANDEAAELLRRNIELLTK
jgi:HK97 family phage prohead protease